MKRCKPHFHIPHIAIRAYTLVIRAQTDEQTDMALCEFLKMNPSMHLSLGDPPDLIYLGLAT